LERPGDVVVHCDSRREAITGVSAASGVAEPAPGLLGGPGSYAQRPGEHPCWLQGLRVKLDRYRQLEPPVTLAVIRRRKDELLALPYGRL